MSITIKKEEFLKRKECFEVQEQIVGKYEALISKYECFVKSTYSFKKSHDKKRHYVPEKKHFINNRSSFTSLWNLLNEGNYTKICHKLKFMISTENVGKVINDLVNMSIMHSIYRKYFILILKDVLKSYEKCGSYVIINNIVSQFRENYIILPTSMMSQKEEYDVFCAMQKHKQKILNTYSFLMDIIDHIDVSIVDIINLTSDIFSKYVHEEYYFDLLINILIVLAGTYKIEVAEQVAKLSDILAVSSDTCTKNKFLVEKIVNMTQVSSTPPHTVR